MYRKQSSLTLCPLAIRSLISGSLVSTMIVGLSGSSPAFSVEAQKQAAVVKTEAAAKKKSDPFQLINNFKLQPFNDTLQKQHPPQLNFKVGSDPIAWSKTARAKLIELLGLPIKKVDLKPVTQAQGKFTVTSNNGQTFTYTREAVQFMSQAGMPAFGYLLLPAGSQKKLPCLICVPGHSGVVDDISGVNDDGSTRTTYSLDYQHDLAVQGVQHGYAVLALESVASGRLQDHKLCANKPKEGQCNRFSAAALIVGQTLIGWNVNQVIRAIDYLQTRPEIDTTRIASLGISRGAAIAMYSAAIDPRVKCAVVASYLNDWQTSLLSFNHCICNFIPGIATYFKMSDVAGLIAPRFLICEGSKDDITFPYSGTEKAFAETKSIFKAFGCSDHANFSVGTGHHVFRGEDCFAQLKKQL